MTFKTGLFNRTSWVIPDEIKYNKEPMNGYNYDNWLNSNNPYDEADEEEREREYHLEQIEGLTEQEIEEYLFAEDIEDPRKHQR